jgi:acyl dehydratase
MDERTIETVDELKAIVGQELGYGDWLEVTQERVDAFAEVSGDFQWIHIDQSRAAAETRFGGTIAHGALTLSIIPALRQGWHGAKIDLHPKMGINYGLNRVRFISPVRVGKRIRLRSKLLSVEDVEPNVYQMVYQQTVEIEGEQRPAMVAETVTRQYL